MDIWSHDRANIWLRSLIVIGLTAIAHTYFEPARGAQAVTSCFASKLECLAACTAQGVSELEKEECSRGCGAKMALCNDHFQSELKSGQWKKRCSSLPDEERYFVDVVELAWQRTSATLRDQSLLLSYFQSRLQIDGSGGFSERSGRREISSLIATLNTKSNAFIRYFDIPKSNEPASVAEALYRDISHEANAFDVLSSAASALAVRALLDTIDDRPTTVSAARSVLALAQNLSKFNEAGSDTSSSKRELIQKLEDMKSRITELQSRIDKVKSKFEVSERKELLEEIQMAQHLCDQAS
jgi:hypothetical protein